ncbi:MAG: phosphatase PAP2 family protein [Eubacteriales bacterium]|nr:phosphatase PAP2 family protein [Eubacteriales bacterium]
MSWEFAFLDFINLNIVNPFLTPIMKVFTYSANSGAIWIVLCLIFLIIKKYRKIGIVMAFALIIDVFLVNICLKNMIHRIRPYEINLLVDILIKKPNDFSFPSGHTAASFAICSSIFMIKQKKLFFVTLIISIIISFSRLYFYVHFPTDIIGGALCGIISGILSYFIYIKIEPKIKEKNII